MAGDHYCCPFELFIKSNGTFGFSGKNKTGLAFSCERMLTGFILTNCSIITTLKLLPRLKVLFETEFYNLFYNTVSWGLVHNEKNYYY